MDEVGEAYRGVRVRVGALVARRRRPRPRTVAPATPDWTVHDLLAHLVGVTADIVSGNLDGVGTDAWAAAQVEARAATACDELLAEWNEHGPVVEEMAGQFGRAAGQLVSDATTHEHDVRGALGAPGARDSDAVAAELRVPRPVARGAARRAPAWARSSCTTATRPTRSGPASRRVPAHRRLRVRARAHRAPQRRADRGVRLGRRVRARAPRARGLRRPPDPLVE